MVTDEELKKIVKISSKLKIYWPFLREIWKVVHTENHLNWKNDKLYTLLSMLRETLFSPTVVWWTLASTFSMIKKTWKWL